MLATAAAEGERHAPAGVRPIDPSRDMGHIARLIEGAFAHELDERGRAALRDMRWMARLSPLVWWWALADPSFRESLSGFVWEEPIGRRRQIVGNVSLNRAPANRQWWIVCNVAVREGYRGRGIARKLTEAALAEAWELGAVGVMLQVYRDNSPALRLYTHLGFEEVAGETALRLDASRPAGPAAPGEYTLRPWRPRDAHAARSLARAALHPAQQWMAPPRADEFEPAAAQRLARWVQDLAAGRRTLRLAAWHAGELAGLATLLVSFRQGEHRLHLRAAPGHAGRVEEALASWALARLEEAPLRPVWATLSAGDGTGALRRLGFQERRTLLTMTKLLG